MCIRDRYSIGPPANAYVGAANRCTVVHWIFHNVAAIAPAGRRNPHPGHRRNSIISATCVSDGARHHYNTDKHIRGELPAVHSDRHRCTPVSYTHLEKSAAYKDVTLEMYAAATPNSHRVQDLQEYAVEMCIRDRPCCLRNLLSGGVWVTFKEYKKLWALPADIKARESRIEKLLRRKDTIAQDTVHGLSLIHILMNAQMKEFTALCVAKRFIRLITQGVIIRSR